MGEIIKLTTKDGATIDAYKAVPTGEPRGAIVVLQEIFGVNLHIRNVADQFAAAGYLAIAPALFDRVAPGVNLGYVQKDIEEGVAIRAKTKIEETLADIAAAVAVASGAGKVGVVGYCWGGTLAYASAARLSGIAAAVGYYGSGIAANIAQKFHAPVQLHFGDQDHSIPSSDIEKIRQANPDVPIFVYPAGHGFSCDERASFDAQSARLARERTLAFFAEHVG
ncbi:MAG: dienelactone hydrolase family protein [Beijerinckiaceae bacterium]